MKKTIYYSFLLLFVFATQAQENLNYQKPPKEILELADYERAPSVSMDSKKENMLLSLFAVVFSVITFGLVSAVIKEIKG